MRILFSLCVLLALFMVAPAAYAGQAAPSPLTTVTSPADDAPVTTWDNMTRKEKRQLRRQMRRELKSIAKEARRAKREGKQSFLADDDQLIALILALIFPPLGVLIWEGELTGKFWICLLLTFLFYLPGLIYALLVIF